MTNELVTTQAQPLDRQRAQRQAAGQAANEAASANVFNRYLAEKADNTKDAQLGDLATFAEYLCRVKAIECNDAPDYAAMGKALQTDPGAWHDIVWGLVDGFREWMLRKGYAITTVNRKLSTVKQYAELAVNAGVIAATEGLLIRNVRGHSHKAGKNVDADRTAAGLATRTSNKKADSVELTTSQVRTLKKQPKTPQGRRDAVIMCLLLDHALRVGELALLEVTSFNLELGTFTFYRPKVDKWDKHTMTTDTARAIRTWFAHDAPAMGPLLRGSRKGGKLTGAGMSERAITARVQELGIAAGLYVERVIDGEVVKVGTLSAHDCRHSCLTIAARNGTGVAALRDMGGWNSPAMALRYVDRSKIGNAGVILDSPDDSHDGDD